MTVACWDCGEAGNIGSWKVGPQGHSPKTVKAGPNVEARCSMTTTTTALAGMPVSRRAETCETARQS
jgi:hypothetical protein